MGIHVTLKQLRPVALALLVLASTAPAALALDAQDFGKKFLAVYGHSLPPTDKLSFDSATANGNNLVFDGITLTVPPGSDAGSTVQLPAKLTFTGVAEQPDGSYTADSLTVPDVDYSFEGGTLTVKSIALKNLYVPGSASPTVVDSVRLFGAASAGPIALTMHGTPAFTIDGFSVTTTFKPSQTAADLESIDSTGSTSGMKLDMTGMDDAEGLAQAKALGLETMTGKVLENGGWTLKDGHIAISEVSIDIDKVGKLKFATDITGYTPAFLQALNTALQTLTAGGSDSAAQGQQTAALLAASQALFLNGLSLRYDDASITGRLLDYVADQQKVTRPALIEQVVASLAAQADSADAAPPGLVKTMQAAVRAFLNDPHSFEVKLAPPAPLGVMTIMAAAMQPDNLVAQLGLKVLVNDKEITAAQAASETGVAPPAAEDSGDSGDAPASDNSGD